MAGAVVAGCGDDAVCDDVWSQWGWNRERGVGDGPLFLVIPVADGDRFNGLSVPLSAAIHGFSSAFLSCFALEFCGRLLVYGFSGVELHLGSGFVGRQFVHWRLGDCWLWFQFRLVSRTGCTVESLVPNNLGFVQYLSINLQNRSSIAWEPNGPVKVVVKSVGKNVECVPRFDIARNKL